MKMGKKKKNSGTKAGNRFFRWIRSDLPDEEDKKSPVLLLGVNKISDSPSVVRRRSTEPHTTGSIRFFRPPKSKYTRGLQGDERLERIRQDLLVHKHKPDRYIPSHHDVSLEPEKKRCLRLNCADNCICERKKNSSDRGSFSFHRPENRQPSICPSEPYGKAEETRDYSENDIEFKYTEHIPNNQPCSSKSSYNITPKSAERRHVLLANLNERFRKTLSLDSRKTDTNRAPLSLPKESRPKSLVNTSSVCVQNYSKTANHYGGNFDKPNQPKKKRKSFFSLDTFFDSKKSDTSSIDDYCSSKYKRFELESDDSPLFKRDNRKEKTPDLLNVPVIIDSVHKRQSDAKRQLEKLENHYYRSLIKTQTVIDAVPKDAKDVDGPSGNANRISIDDDEVEYIEPIRSNFTSQSTLILEKNIPSDYSLKPDSLLTINTDETDIKLPSSTVSPKSNDIRNVDNDLDSIGIYEIEVKETDLLKDCSKDLTVKVMDKSVDSIGSCSLDVDASTDFSDTTSGSLNLLTPSSTTSRIRDFNSRFQERVASNLPTVSQHHTPTVTPVRTPDDPTPTPKRSEHLLKPPPKVHLDAGSHRSRGHHKKRDDILHKKPSYLNLACSVNGYTNLTTYDSKLRQDINKSREASPIRPITHTYQYKSENNSLLVPVPVSANKLLVPTFGPHDTRTDLTAKAPTKAHTDPYLATSPLHVYMAAENKQLKNDFLGANMTTASRPYISSESKTFATSMLHQKSDEVDNAKELTFKSSYSETNFRKTVTNGKETRYSSESYTISSNGVSKRVEITKENGEKLTSPMKSFIQQRVERLYGPGALAQGFFNQKRHKVRSQSEEDDPKVLTEKSLNCQNDRYVTPRKSNSFESETLYTSPNGESDTGVSLPVLRHLRPEFRAQLPILSPKKSLKTELSPQKPEDIPSPKTEVVEASVVNVTNGISVINLNDTVKEVNGVNVEQNGTQVVVRDAHYFLDLEKRETERLIALAATAEKELENLQDQDVSEEVLGLLRSAAGKARLLATQKMQQFEGLCYNHINERLDEPYPTTLQDLQGFWDMVCLQVDNVNALYKHIAALKANGWIEISSPMKKPAPLPGASPLGRARATPPPAQNAKARHAAEKREADRKAMMEHRRRVARERQLAAKAAAGPSQPHDDMAIEGSQEVEIFVGKGAKPSTKAPQGDSGPTLADS